MCYRTQTDPNRPGKVPKYSYRLPLATLATFKDIRGPFRLQDNLEFEENLKYEDQIKYEDALKYEDDLKYEDNLKYEEDLKYENNLKQT